MKAWVANTDYSEGSAIIFAENRNKAKVLAQSTGACEDEPYIDIRVKRLKELDGMENHEPKDNPWLNEEIRMILVKEYGWSCIEPEFSDCETCCAKEHCMYFIK